LTIGIAFVIAGLALRLSDRPCRPKGWTPAACLLACATGIPLGIALYNAIRGQTLGPIDLTPLTYIAVSLTALLLYAAIAVTPARLLARRPITPQLAYE
jgi:hypothetical protein